MMGFLVLLMVVGFVVAIINFSDQRVRIKNLEYQVTLLNLELQKLIRSLKESPVKPEEKKQADNSAYVPKPAPPVAERKPAPEPIVEKPISPLLPPRSETKAQPVADVLSTYKSAEERKWKQKPPEPKSRTSAEWEALIGGKILNRIGALAIIIGMGFFLKYAIDNNWISPLTRVCIGFGIGAILLFGGHYFQKKDFKIFSQGLVGAGLAVLYLSVYASFNYYHLITNQGVAIAMMSVVTAITFWQGFKYNSLIIALFGWTGGFLTPFLISTGKANEAGLFTYIAFLDLALLLIVLWKEKWHVLESLTLLGTIIVYYLWYFDDYASDKMGTTIFFLALFWAMFLALEVLRILKTEKKITLLHQLVSVANGGFFFGSLCVVMRYYDRTLGMVSVLIAGTYFLVFLLIKNKRANEENLYVRYLLSVILLMVISAEIEFDNFGISVAWAAEALALSLIASRYKNTIVLYSAMAVTALALINFSVSPDAFYTLPKNFHLLLNWPVLALASIMASAISSYFLSLRVPNNNSYSISSGLIGAWVLCLFLITTIETNNLFSQLAQTPDTVWSLFYKHNLIYFLSIEWLLIALPLVWFGLGRKLDALLSSGFILTGLSILFACFYGLFPYEPSAMFHPFFNMRALAIGLSAAGIFIQIGWVDKKLLYDWFTQLLNLMRVVMTAGVFILITVETRDLFESLSQHADKMWAAFYDNNLAFAFSIEWILLSMPLIWFGLNRKLESYFVCGFVLIIISIASSIVFGVMTYNPLELFFPFFNLRGLAILLLAACLFIQSRWIEKQPLFDWFNPALNVMRVVMVVIVFILITMETKDAFEKKIAAIDNGSAIEFTNQLIVDIHNQQQLFISGAWLFYSMLLLVIGIYRRRLSVRIASIIIFGITIGKVFFYDLSNLNSLNRIISFIALGVILLLVSFLYQKFKGIIFANEE